MMPGADIFNSLKTSAVIQRLPRTKDKASLNGGMNVVVGRWLTTTFIPRLSNTNDNVTDESLKTVRLSLLFPFDFPLSQFSYVAILNGTDYKQTTGERFMPPCCLLTVIQRIVNGFSELKTSRRSPLRSTRLAQPLPHPSPQLERARSIAGVVGQST